MKIGKKTASGCIILLCIVVYFPILGHEFLTAWDDGWMVMNEYTETWSWKNIQNIFTEFYYGQYSPINQVCYTILYQIFGSQPFWYHLFNLLLHITNALLIFFIVQHIIQLNTQQKDNKKIILIPFGVALLFSIHPLQVESVAWISASKILVYSFFYLWALWFYLRYLQKGKGIYYILMLLSFVLSFGGKEQAVTLPVCLLWIDLACRRNFRNELLWYEKIPVFILAFIFSYITLKSNASNNVGLLVQNDFYPFHQRIVFACYAFCEYIIKIFLPINLLYIYPFPILIGESLPLRFWVYPALLVTMVVCFWKFLKQRPVWIGLLWFLIHLSLVLHIVPLSRINVVADRYIYLAAPGVFFIIVWYFFVAWDVWPKFRKLLAGIALLWLIFLGIQTHLRTHVWHDNTTLKMKMNDLLEQRDEKPVKKLEE